LAGEDQSQTNQPDDHAQLAQAGSGWRLTLICILESLMLQHHLYSETDYIAISAKWDKSDWRGRLDIDQNSCVSGSHSCFV